MKKTSDKKKVIAYCICAAAGVFVLGIGAGTLISNLWGNGGIAQLTTQPSSQITQSSSEAAETTVQAQTETKSTVRMMCSGENFVQQSIFEQAKSRGSGDKYDFGYIYEQISDIIAMSDFSVLNQSTPMCADYGASDEPLFNTPQAVGDELSKIGFSVVNQAGSHVFDMGVPGVQQTISFWKSKANTVLTGLYSNDADMNTLKTNTINGITFAHLGFTQSLNSHDLSTSPVRVICPQGSAFTEETYFTTMQNMVKKASEAADIVCAYVSFERSDSSSVSDSQDRIIKNLVNSGADVIIGTGTGALQPVKFVERSDGTRALVMYSLGYLISAQTLATNMVGAIADITFSKDATTGKAVISNAGVIPVITHYGENFSDVHIVPLYAYDDAQATSHGMADFSYSYISGLLSSVIDPNFLESNPFNN